MPAAAITGGSHGISNWACGPEHPSIAETEVPCLSCGSLLKIFQGIRATRQRGVSTMYEVAKRQSVRNDGYSVESDKIDIPRSEDSSSAARESVE